MNARSLRSVRLLLPFLLVLSALGIVPMMARANIFDDAASAMGNVAGGSAALGGYILGIMFIAAIAICVLLMLGSEGGEIIFIIAVAAAGFAVLVGWWPTWTLIPIVLILALLVMNKREAGASA